MKRILIPIFLLPIFFASDNVFSQKTDYPIHLFIGAFTRTTVNDTTVEIWDAADDTELAGRTIYTYTGGSMLSETMRIFYKNGKLNYCATIMEQDPNDPQGEVCFELISYKDLVFTFENKQHDFPKRIIYNFNNWRNIVARIEDDSKGYDLDFARDYNMFQVYTTKGVFIKEPFENKGGKIIEGVYDYFFQTQGIKYFIKLRDAAIKKDEIDKVSNKEVKVSFFIREGLWDADDNTHQSRIGKYVTIAGIYE
ncbi:MAG: DUF6265 family protein [Ignavibacteriota bacterium]